MTTDSWNVNTGGNWFTAANWSEKHIPLSGENVVITTANPVVVTFNGGASAINSLTVGGDIFDFDSGSLVIAEAASIGGELDVAGGEITFGAATAVSDFDQTGGTVDVKAGTLSFVGPIDYIAGSIIGAGTLAIVGGAATIAAGGSLAVANLVISGADTKFTDDLSVTATYEGGVSLSAGATVSLTGASVVLTGKTTATNGTLNGKGALYNAGTMTVSGLTIGGTLDWITSGATTQTGNVVVGDSTGAAATLTIAAGGVYAIADDSGIEQGVGAGSIIYNYGSISKTTGVGTSVIATDLTDEGVVNVGIGALAFDGAVNAISGTIAGSGMFVLGGGDTTIESGAKINSASFAVTDTLVTLDQNLTYAGSFYFEAAGTIISNGSDLVLTGPSDFTGGVINGDTTIYTTGASDVSSLTIGGTSTWINTGAVTQDGGNVTLGNSNNSIATLMNAMSGVYDIVGDYGIFPGEPVSSDISNSGLFEKTGGSGVSMIYTNVQNSGEILAASGEIEVLGSLTGTGRDQVDAGAVIQVNDPVSAGQTFVYSGSGGELALEDLQASGAQIFHGVISGFGAGDMIEIGAATFGGFKENAGGTSGVLTLHDGAATTSITLLGDYSSTNFASSMNGFQTVLTYHP